MFPDTAAQFPAKNARTSIHAVQWKGRANLPVSPASTSRRCGDTRWGEKRRESIRLIPLWRGGP